jgi:hypothetical protein
MSGRGLKKVECTIYLANKRNITARFRKYQPSQRTHYFELGSTFRLSQLTLFVRYSNLLVMVVVALSCKA